MDSLVENVKILCGEKYEKGGSIFIIGGGTFSQSLVLQAFSDVMVIIDEVSNLQRGQFANSGPHPAILLLTRPIEK